METVFVPQYHILFHSKDTCGDCYLVHLLPMYSPITSFCQRNTTEVVFMISVTHAQVFQELYVASLCPLPSSIWNLN